MGRCPPFCSDSAFDPSPGIAGKSRENSHRRTGGVGRQFTSVANEPGCDHLIRQMSYSINFRRPGSRRVRTSLLQADTATASSSVTAMAVPVEKQHYSERSLTLLA